MNSRRLLLHIGPHKTGSTAIQIALANALEADERSFATLERLGGAHQVAELFSGGHFDEGASLLSEIPKAPATVVLSSENFSRLEENQIARLLADLPFDDVRIIYFLRNPLNRLMSMWREQIKHGYRHTFVEFIGARLARPFQDRLINDAVTLRAWIKAVGPHQLDIHLYDRIAEASSFFLETYFPTMEFSAGNANRVNESIKTTTAEVYRALAGYQWHLLRDRSFDGQVRELAEKVDAAIDASGVSYRREFGLSLDSAILSAIEKNLQSEFGALIKQQIGGGPLFTERTSTWQFIGHEIWFEHTELIDALIDLRRSIHAKHGLPQYDARLRSI